MKFVIQRVHQSRVFVQGKEISSIGKGLLVLAGIQRYDSQNQADCMINKLLRMRIFEDETGKMNRSVQAVNGAILMVPNFTLYANVSQGNRPGFSEAEKPEKARKLYNSVVAQLRKESNLQIKSGAFGADMDIELVNDGPVTMILEREAVK